MSAVAVTPVGAGGSAPGGSLIGKSASVGSSTMAEKCCANVAPTTLDSSVVGLVTNIRELAPLPLSPKLLIVYVTLFELVPVTMTEPLEKVVFAVQLPERSIQ